MAEAVREAVDENDGKRDLAVAVDGSWQKRGFSSKNGLVTVTSVDTGKIRGANLKKAELLGETYHHKNSLPVDVVEAMRPVFRDLANPELLKKCLHGGTQNPNESVNNVIWSRVPKKTFVQLVLSLDNLVALHFKYDFWRMTATAGSDVVQSGRPIFDEFFQHLWPYIGNNTANVVFQMVKRLWLIRIDQ
ncbi:uncharacterized protein TNCV_676051 [Trichonephila clavipes]|nr:uncharacterized protein TNCV_676051 [Trichonephila clavipes]